MSLTTSLGVSKLSITTSVLHFLKNVRNNMPVNFVQNAKIKLNGERSPPRPGSPSLPFDDSQSDETKAHIEK
jgi:hypothetical protein